MYKYSAPFKAKINYTKWSFEQFNNPKAFSTTSDGARIFSFQAALKIFKSNPIIGVGTGDVPLEMKKQYSILGVPEISIIPHNQFLLVLISLGLIGVCYFIVLLIYLYKKVAVGNILISLMMIIFLFMFMIEPFLETQFGINIFLFLILFFHQKKNQVDCFQKN